MIPPLQSLGKKAAPQWEQHKPSPNDEIVTLADYQLTPKPPWFKKEDVTDIEHTMFPE
jgi:hypothetical protein